MSVYLGDYAASSTIYFLWSTNAADGSSSSRGPSTDGTVRIYKDADVTFSVAGIADIEDFDSITGIHSIAIDTSSDTDFYSAATDFEVVIVDLEVDGVQNINAVLAHFSITNRS